MCRVTIGDLKGEILQQIADDDRGAQVCRELAHMYHYYLHGENGNLQKVFTTSQCVLVTSIRNASCATVGLLQKDLY